MTSGGYNKRTKEEVEKIVNDLGYILLDEYTEKHNRTVFIQDELGYKYNVQLDSLIQGHIPRFVAKGNPETLENISLWLIQEEKLFELCKGNEYMVAKKNIFFHCLVPECDMDFDMSWQNVYSKNYGCPFCSGQRVSDKNRLSLVCPDIAREWDHNLNEGTPEDFSYGSTKTKFWICPKGHESYPSTIHNRTSAGTRCPRCSGNMVSDDNRLSIVRPDISSEWDHELNEDTPHDVSYSPNKMRWWRCPKGHQSYPATIAHRTNGRGCPRCADEQKESKMATEIKRWANDTFKDVDVEHKMFKNPETGAWLKCDIYLGEKESTNGVYIEVHGQQHFKFMPYYHKTEKNFEDSKYRDKIKKKFAKANGIYIEIDLRKIKLVREAKKYIKGIMNENNYLRIKTSKN